MLNWLPAVILLLLHATAGCDVAVVSAVVYPHHALMADRLMAPIRSQVAPEASSEGIQTVKTAKRPVRFVQPTQSAPKQVWFEAAPLRAGPVA